MTLEFAICTDENFVVPALVCLTSIFENNRDDECHVTVLTEGISDISTEKFIKLSDAYNQQINICKIDAGCFDSMITRGRYPVSMYFRFLLPQILADSEKVLYLDCDIMVRRSLRQLFETNLAGKACGVVIDQQCDDTQIHNRLRLTSDYFNSGVMLMNLNEWREKDYTEKIIDFIEKNPDKCIFPDQDALNAVLNGNVRFLELEYNLQEMWLTMLDYARFSFSRYHDLEQAKKDPAIIHFCVGDKPWFSECKNPYRKEYLEYAHLHDFIGFTERKHYSRLYFRLDAEIQRLKRWQKYFINK